MTNAEHIKSDPMALRITEARDEMNLAEFPLCALAHRLRPDQKTLRFEDRVWDQGQNAMVNRQLTITGSDAYGLPTALDDEVLLGLIQLTKQHGFADRKVPFTRYQLLRVLGWRDESRSYRRVEDSLNRWTGVTLYYQNAWWNKADQCWVSEKFHVLDNVWLCHRAERPADAARLREGRAASAFVWNDVLFRSFQTGNLKSIDFEFLKGLQSSVSRRLYRFLDKRFYHRRCWEFDLREFAWEHIGLARSYAAADIKHKLHPAISELERKGFLQPLAEGERFVSAGMGRWCVRFAKRRSCRGQSAQSTAVAPVDGLVKELVARGIILPAAQKTVRDYPADRIMAKIEVFDWLMERKDRGISRNPAGFLLTSIKRDFAAPPGFIRSAQRQKQAKLAAAQERQREQEKRQRLSLKEAAQQERERAIADFWNSLTEGEKAQFKDQALREATVFQRKLLAQGGKAAAAAFTSLLAAQVNRFLDVRSMCALS